MPSLLGTREQTQGFVLAKEVLLILSLMLNQAPILWNKKGQQFSW